MIYQTAVSDIGQLPHHLLAQGCSDVISEGRTSGCEASLIASWNDGSWNDGSLRSLKSNRLCRQYTLLGCLVLHIHAIPVSSRVVPEGTYVATKLPSSQSKIT